VRRYRWIAFTLSGLVVGLAGGLSGRLARELNPGQLHWIFSAQIVLAIVKGGSRFLLRSAAGAFAFVAIDELANRITAGRSLLFGALLIAAVMLFPQGVASGAAPLLRAVRLAWQRRLGRVGMTPVPSPKPVGIRGVRAMRTLSSVSLARGTMNARASGSRGRIARGISTWLPADARRAPAGGGRRGRHPCLLAT
jgi:hypothetical protein